MMSYMIYNYGTGSAIGTIELTAEEFAEDYLAQEQGPEGIVRLGDLPADRVSLFPQHAGIATVTPVCLA